MNDRIKFVGLGTLFVCVITTYFLRVCDADIAMALIQVAFLFAPAFQIRYLWKNGYTTSHSQGIINFLGLLSVSIMYYTINLPVSTTMTLISSTEWGIVFILSRKNGGV